MSPQEEISSRPTYVEELPIKTLVDLPAEPIIELVSSLIAIGPHYPSRDVYDLLQIFLQETILQEIGTLICGLDFMDLS